MLKKLLFVIGAISGTGLILLFGMFYRPDLDKEQLGRYITAESEFMTLPNGATVHYRDEGHDEGPILVMIHGGFGSLQNWDGWVKELRADFRLISFDLLGHGLTGSYPANRYSRVDQRDSIMELLHELGVEHFSVAGNSFGGGIALEIALAHPEQVDALILVDSEGVPNGEDGYDIKGLSDETAVSPDDPTFTTVTKFEKFMSKFIGPNAIRGVLKSMIYNKDLFTKDFVDSFGRVLRYRGNREAQILMFRQGLWLVQKNGPQDLRPRLPEIKAPTLVIQGAADELVPMRVAKIFADEIPSAELFVVEEAGHLPMIEKPAETADAARDFVRSVTSGSKTR